MSWLANRAPFRLRYCPYLNSHQWSLFHIAPLGSWNQVYALDQEVVRPAAGRENHVLAAFNDGIAKGDVMAFLGIDRSVEATSDRDVLDDDVVSPR